MRFNQPTFAGPIGSLERINQDAKSYGGTAQAVEKSQLFSRPNQFLAGVSYDHGRSATTRRANSAPSATAFSVTGSGIIVTEPEGLAPRDLIAENSYYGLYFSNTLDVTDQLAVTIGGRYNHATIQLTDLTGNFPDLNTTNKYDALQSHGRRDVQVRQRLIGLRQLLGGEPRADSRRTRLR